MQIRALKDIFCEGAYRHKGEVFQAKKHWKHTDLLDAEGEDVPTSKLNRKEIMHALALAGVKFKATVPTEELEALLAEAKAKGAPASVGVPSKEMQSSGDKDVI